MADFLDIAKGVLGKIAPTLALAVGGPFAGQATQVICNALGLAPDTPQDQVATAMQSATPDQLLALKKADADFKVAMRQLDIQETQLGYDDTANARAREVAVRDWTPGLLAFGVTLGFFGLLGVLAFHDVPTSNANALTIMLGALGAAFGGVIAYYFGSSRGSQDKDKMLWQSVPK